MFHHDQPLVRFTIRLPSHDRKLQLYGLWRRANYHRIDGLPDPDSDNLFVRRAMTEWWLYFGDIPPSKIVEFTVEDAIPYQPGLPDELSQHPGIKFLVSDAPSWLPVRWRGLPGVAASGFCTAFHGLDAGAADQPDGSLILAFGVAKDTTFSLGHNVIYCVGTGFVRFNDDSGHSRFHLGLDRSHGGRPEDRHPGIVDQPDGSSEECGHRREWYSADQTDQPANYNADLGSMKKMDIGLKNGHRSSLVFGHDDTGLEFKLVTAFVRESFYCAGSIVSSIDAAECCHDDIVYHCVFTP